MLAKSPAPVAANGVAGSAPAPVAIAQNVPEPSNAIPVGAVDLPPDVREIAEIIGIVPTLEKLAASEPSLTDMPQHSVERMERRDRVLYLRQKLVLAIDTALLEINATRNTIDTASANLADAEAVLNEHRARTIRRNSMINFVSGGVTKMVGYGMAMAPISLFTTNLLEIIDGGIQSTLSGLTIKDQRDEKQMLNGIPQFLSDIITAPLNDPGEYQKSVWRYLNNVPPGSKTKLTRRQQLVQDWKKNGILLREPKMVQGPNGQIALSMAVAGKWIADHSAMLSGLKSTVGDMSNGLVTLSHILQDRYSADAEFE